MARGALTVGFLGRIPPPLGGAGLEVQMQRTAAALERLGHRVVFVDAAEASQGFDVLHAFGSEPAVWHQLRHWTRHRSPLVVTSVVVVSPGREERALRLSARMPGVLTSGRMRSEVLGRADAVVAATAYERELVTSLGAEAERVWVVANGADPAAGGNPPTGVPSEGYALMVGSVSPRKRQLEVLRALGGDVPVVVAGAFAGDDGERGEWERTVEETGATWLGPVEDAGRLSELQRRARVLVHLSSAEVQSLAVVEALAHATPAVLSDIPSHRELRDAHPAFVALVSDPSDVPGAIAELGTPPEGAAPRIPSWDEVAGELEAVYRSVLD